MYTCNVHVYIPCIHTHDHNYAAFFLCFTCTCESCIDKHNYNYNYM